MTDVTHTRGLELSTCETHGNHAQSREPPHQPIGIFWTLGRALVVASKQVHAAAHSLRAFASGLTRRREEVKSPIFMEYQTGLNLHSKGVDGASVERIMELASIAANK